MLHPSFEPDTLFLVFEEDWRLERDAPAPPSEDATESAGSHGFLLRGTRPEGRSHFVPTAGADKVSSDSQNVANDLVSFVTRAARSEHGDIVWMTWQPGQGDVKSGVTKIKSGAMLLAFSVKGADVASEAIRTNKITANHFDIELHRFVLEHGSKLFSYVFPPLGNYSSHVSGCEPEYRDTARPSCWDTKWVCPGTRRSQDTQKRDKYLAFPKKKGNPDWLSLIDLDKEYDDLAWKSFWDVPDSVRPDLRGKKRAAPGSASSSQLPGAFEFPVLEPALDKRLVFGSGATDPSPECL